MSQDKELTYQRLGELWEKKDLAVLDTEGNKYIMFSDTHLGDGKGADDFHENEETLKTALEYYKRNNYKLILLGDIEELWQFDLSDIDSKYRKSIYEKIKEFGDENLYRVFGNHDMDWRLLVDPAKNEPVIQGNAAEALKMKDKNGRIRILLAHGHQGSTESDKYSWSSRFFVRFFRIIEPIAKWLGFARPPETTKSQIAKDYERILYSWAKQAKVMLICGHSHRAIFSSKSYIDRLKEKIAKLQKEISENRDNKKLVEKNLKDIKRWKEEIADEKSKKREIEPTESAGEPLPCYFNTGCGLYCDGVTGIEIADDEIRLAKWHRDPKADPRYEIYEKGNLSEYSEIVGGR